VTRSILAGLVLVGGLLVGGCSNDPTCDDVDALTEELGAMDADDPDFNTVANKLAQALADCNS
jgi:outer membrane murein-binding lipoprotein Lpp